jgi:hypothetical protein
MSVTIENAGAPVVALIDYLHAVRDYSNRASNTPLDIMADVLSTSQTLVVSGQILLNVFKASELARSLGPYGVGITAAAMVADYGKLLDAWGSNPPKVDQGEEAIIGLMSGALGIISLVPGPQQGVFLAASLLAAAGKQGWKNRGDMYEGLKTLTDQLLGDGSDSAGINDIDYDINGNVSGNFRTGSSARNPIPRDPLAIDLDGDGIETAGVGTSPVLFDHNADGIRTGTGWVKGDDGWLVLDRNGNGLIDSGRELFGVDTLLSGTPGVDATYANTGFEALKTLDSNGDNLFNATDAAFAQVRIWQDTNQDGISQASELFTLAQKNIASIGLTASNTTQNLGNGNTVSGTATVTRINGTTTLAETVSVAGDTTAANLFLGVNPFYREFTDTIAPTTQAQNLPNMRGSGWVRDLGLRGCCKVDSCSRNKHKGYRQMRHATSGDVSRTSKRGECEVHRSFRSI